MTPDPEELRRMAEELRRQADELLKAAGEAAPEETTEQVATITPEPVGSLPEDGEKPIVDPAEQMDMRDELDKVRDLLNQRGFVKRASSAEGEVWEKQGPGGAPGFKATFVSTPHGRIRLEIRNPMGLIVTQAEPATLVDSEIALGFVPRG